MLAEGQVQIRDLVMGPGTDYRILDGFNPWSRHARADQSAARAWGHGSWSGAEWTDEAVVPLSILVETPDLAGWLPAHLRLLATFAASHEDLELRFVTGGIEFVMFGRPRMVEPDTHLIGLGRSFTRCAFVALDPHVYSGVVHTTGAVPLPSQSGGLLVPGGPKVLNANSGFEVDTSGWAAQSSTIARSTAQAYQGVASLQVTPDGIAASGGFIGDRVPVIEGRDYAASLWAYSPAGWSDLRPAVDWWTALSGGSFITSSLGSGFVVPAGVWTHLVQVFTAPAGAKAGQIRGRHGGTPTAGDVWFADEVRLFQHGSGGGGLLAPLRVAGVLVGGSTTLTNAGTAETGLALRVDGPVPEPAVTLQRPDGITQTLRLLLDLTAGQWLDIDTRARTVFLNGLPSASRRGDATGEFPLLPPGTSVLRFSAADAAAGTLTATHRDAWW